MARVSQDEFYSDRTMIAFMEHIKEVVGNGGIKDIEGYAEGEEWVFKITLNDGTIKYVRFPIPPAARVTWDAITDKPEEIKTQETTTQEFNKRMPNPISWGGSEDILVKYGNVEGVTSFLGIDKLTAWKQLKKVPDGGTEGQILTKQADGYAWAAPQAITIQTQGTWQCGTMTGEFECLKQWNVVQLILFGITGESAHSGYISFKTMAGLVFNPPTPISTNAAAGGMAGLTQGGVRNTGAGWYMRYGGGTDEVTCNIVYLGL